MIDHVRLEVGDYRRSKVEARPFHDRFAAG